MNEDMASYGYFNFIQRAARNGLFHRSSFSSGDDIKAYIARRVVAERSGSSDADLAVKALNKANPHVRRGSHSDRKANRAVTNFDQGYGVIT